MKKQIQCCLASTILILSAECPSAQAEKAVAERIYFVQQDGLSAMVYTTSRTGSCIFFQTPGSGQVT
jgi:hypothetical protein